ncbi:hypothetical protein B0J11DRAFT_146789 [Dendryphion nanum]|uniref:Transmembrane protein n=1 Tax=Dendryphion nanum TaxID=256645 RepID=A0A9P9D5Z8_9PLEO|nr:hypothetical protein B0J11DRAFT_146789 [Dendryphion nanum]
MAGSHVDRADSGCHRLLFLHGGYLVGHMWFSMFVSFEGFSLSGFWVVSRSARHLLRHHGSWTTSCPYSISLLFPLLAFTRACDLVICLSVFALLLPPLYCVCPLSHFHVISLLS